jgi:hypothetical protein
LAVWSSTLYAALAPGAVAVTPNRRLARFLHRQFDVAQQASGRSAWPTPTILPYSAWLEQLWLDALAADTLPGLARLVTAAQSAYLWGRIVADATARTAPLIDPRGTAQLSADAWTLIHAWGAGGESWRGWTRTEIGDDPAAFVDWAEVYSATLARQGALDPAQLGDALAGCAARMPQWRDRVVLLTGFIELTPQQDRVLAALAGIGAHIVRNDLLAEAPRLTRRAAAATPRDELARAFTWARRRRRGARPEVDARGLTGVAPKSKRLLKPSSVPICSGPAAKKHRAPITSRSAPRSVTRRWSRRHST